MTVDHVTLETSPKGLTVMVEPELREGLTRRVFRYTQGDCLEWAAWEDWRENYDRARFYAYHSRELPESMRVRAATVEEMWSAICREAGWTQELSCSPNGSALAAYFHKLDSLVASRAPELRAAIERERASGDKWHGAYLDGIAAAITRAIEAPR